MYKRSEGGKIQENEKYEVKIVFQHLLLMSGSEFNRNFQQCFVADFRVAVAD